MVKHGSVTDALFEIFSKCLEQLFHRTQVGNSLNNFSPWEQLFGAVLNIPGNTLKRVDFAVMFG